MLNRLEQAFIALAVFAAVGLLYFVLMAVFGKKRVASLLLFAAAALTGAAAVALTFFTVEHKILCICTAVLYALSLLLSLFIPLRAHRAKKRGKTAFSAAVPTAVTLPFAVLFAVFYGVMGVNLNSLLSVEDAVRLAKAEHGIEADFLARADEDGLVYWLAEQNGEETLLLVMPADRTKSAEVRTWPFENAWNAMKTALNGTERGEVYSAPTLSFDVVRPPEIAADGPVLRFGSRAGLSDLSAYLYEQGGALVIEWAEE